MVIKDIGYDYAINNTALVGSNFYFGIFNVNLLLTMSKSYAQVNYYCKFIVIESLVQNKHVGESTLYVCCGIDFNVAKMLVTSCQNRRVLLTAVLSADS